MKNTFLYLIFTFFLTAHSQNYYLFVGTYTYNNSGAKGIYVYKLDGTTGALSFVSHTDSTVINPTYIAVAPDEKHLYVTTEARIPKAGSISVFSFDEKQGKLSFVNKQPSGGDNPSYVAVNKSQTWVVTSNFSAGSLAAFPINKDGSIKPYTQLIQHKGKLDSLGKENPHVHATVFSADQKFVVVPDPGAEQIAVYAFDEKQKEKPFLANPKTIPSRSASFVRHYDFHPNGKFAYAIHERSGTVAAYSYQNGVLDSIQVIAAHDENLAGPFTSSDIHVSPDGKFLYAANRGTENNIAIFSIDGKTGKLNRIGLQPTLGEVPRNFTIDPSGKFLLVGNQQSGSIVVFKRDANTGLLTDTGNRAQVPQPAVLKLLPRK